MTDHARSQGRTGERAQVTPPERPPSTDRERYRRTDRTQDVGFAFGAVSATALPGPVLVELLSRLHLTESAARNTLAKMTRQGALESSPSGRVSVYSLPVAVMEKYRQIEGAAAPVPWGGEFHAVIYRAPESSRWYRDRLQYAAEYFGFGLLRPGVLIGTRDNAGAMIDWLGEVPADVVLHRVALRPADLAEARAMASAAWDLQAMATEYGAVTGAIDEAIGQSYLPPLEEPEALWEVYRRWNRLYREVIALQMRDPMLPVELLPSTWPRRSHFAHLEQLNAVWGPTMTRFLREQVAPRDPDHLAAYYERHWPADTMLG